MDILISVIIPVYNRDYCLARCLDSVLSQTFTDWECILVDDGSTDQTLSVCRRYAEADSRFRVYSQPNGGASVARNRGLELAKGEYIAFIDSDDWVEGTYLQLLYDSAAGDTMPFCGQEVKDSLGTFLREAPVKNDRLYRLDRSDPNLPGLLIEHLFGGILTGPVCKLYNRKIIEKHHISFPPDISWGEDLIFNCSYYLYISKLKGVPFSLYHVIKQKVSLTEKSVYDFFLTDVNQRLCDCIFDFSLAKGLDDPLYKTYVEDYYVLLFFRTISGVLCMHDRVSWKKRYERMKWLVFHADRNKFKRSMFRPDVLGYKSMTVYFRIPVLLFLFYEIKYFFLSLTNKTTY